LRSIVITLISLVAVIAAALATAPHLIDWNDYRGLLTRQAEAITGGAVAIDGRISLSLLPIPTLSLAQTSLTGGDGGGGRARLAIDRIDLRLHALPLLRGEVRIGDIRLVRPALEVDRSPATSPANDGNLLRSLTALRPGRLVVADGRVVVRDRRAYRLDAIEIEVVAQSPDGPFALRGGFETAARTFDLEARIGRFGPDDVGTLQLTLAAPGPQAASLRYDGAVWWQAGKPRLRGDLTLAGKNIREAAALVGAALDRPMPPLPPSLGASFEVAGRLELDRQALQLDGLRLQLAGTRANGGLSLAFGGSPTMMLNLQTERLELVDLLGARPADLTPLVALAHALRGEIDLSVAALQYRDRSADRIRLRLTLTGDGEVVVEQASAILPGQTDLRFAGGLATADEGVDLSGDVDIVTDDLGALLAWLDLAPRDVASGRLRTLSVSAALAIDDDKVQLSEAEIRVDATQLRGSATLDTGERAGATRPRLALDLVLERLDIDPYRPDLMPMDAARLLQRALRHTDAEIATRIGRLTWRGLLMRDVVVALRADQGRLQVSNASLEIGGEAQVRLDGQADLGSGAFAWAAELHTTRVARLLRRLDLPAPLILSRAPPLTLKVAAAGRPEQFDLEVEIDDGTGRLAATGAAGWVDDRPRYDLDVELRHPDVNALLRPLGARTGLGSGASAAALSFTGKLTGAAGQHTVAGSARLGEMSLTGLLAWQPEDPRPRYDLQISVAEPSIEVLTALLEVAGYRSSALLLDTPVLGNWPRQPVDLGWLSRFDGSLKLSAKGGLAGEGSELVARLQDATLYVDRASARLPQGTLSTELTLDADAPLPFLVGSLDLRAVDAAWLAARLQLEPAVEGSMDLIAEATAAGSSLFDLVRTLIGRMDLAISAGRLVGDEIAPIRQALRTGGNNHEQPSVPAPDPTSGGTQVLPFTDLVAHFALDRGMAVTESVKLDVDDAAVAVAGVVDLLLWATDLTVEVETAEHPDEPIALEVVGPLKQPQTRLTVPPALRASTAAP
jgi:uncharacterized protein involved in outer membrane biogenesis